jgi:hypothetical protein
MEWLLLGNGLMLDLGYVSSLVQDVVVARPVKQPQHRGASDRTMVRVCWFCIEATIDLFAW